MHHSQWTREISNYGELSSLGLEGLTGHEYFVFSLLGV